MDTIWVVALVLFCFMTGHSRTAALIMFWATGLFSMALAGGAGVAIWSDFKHMDWIIALPSTAFVMVFVFVIAWLLLVFVNGLVFGAVDSVLRAIRG